MTAYSQAVLSCNQDRSTSQNAADSSFLVTNEEAALLLSAEALAVEFHPHRLKNKLAKIHATGDLSTVVQHPSLSEMRPWSQIASHLAVQSCQ